MAYALSPTANQAFQAVGDVLAAILPTPITIIRGQENFVPEPATPNFVTMTHTFRQRLATTVDSIAVAGSGPTATTTEKYMEAVRMDIQLDVHGPDSADNAQIIQVLFRDHAACDLFSNLTPPIDIQPLYSEDARQVPFINAANQFEDRWVVDLALQANFAVVTSSQSADTLASGIINVEATYPP